MAMTGFDPSLVTPSINKINDAYGQLMNALYGKMQNEFVNTMGETWACNQAQAYFRKVKEVVDALLSSSHRTFQSIVDAMNAAASDWAATTETEWSNISFSGDLKNVDVECIKENINGVRGIDEASATSISNVLPKISSDADSALSDAANAVSNCGFVGRDMEQQLVSSLNKIKADCSSQVTELANTLKQAVSDTVSSYGNVGDKIRSNFTVNG